MSCWCSLASSVTLGREVSYYYSCIQISNDTTALILMTLVQSSYFFGPWQVPVKSNKKKKKKKEQCVMNYDNDDVFKMNFVTVSYS